MWDSLMTTYQTTRRIRLYPISINNHTHGIDKEQGGYCGRNGTLLRKELPPYSKSYSLLEKHFMIGGMQNEMWLSYR